MGTFLSPTTAELNAYNNGLCFSQKESNKFPMIPTELKNSSGTTRFYTEGDFAYSQNSQAMITYFESDLSYGGYNNMLVRAKDVYMATYKRIKIMVFNRRSSGVLKVDNLSIRPIKSDNTNPARAVTALQTSTISINNGSYKIYYASIPIDPVSYNKADYYMGIYVGTFTASRKVYLGNDYTNLYYSGSGTSGYFRSNITYKDFIDKHTVLYIGIGDNGQSITGSWSGIAPQFRNYVNIVTDAMYPDYLYDPSEPYGSI